ncbi:MAG: DUF4189 domain-containing protein [Methylovirgula sp.]
MKIKRVLGFLGLAFAALAFCIMGQTLPAAAACDAGWGMCPEALGGGCAPLGSVCCAGGTHVGPGQSCPSETIGNWGALTAGLWNDSSGAAHVSSGAAWNYRTISLASDAAMAQCQSYGGQNCRVVSTFGNGGCGYITVGTGGSGAVRWGIGPTPADAINQCSSGGFVCRPPVGGCTAPP